MAGFLYFVPDVTAFTRADAARVGLAYAFDTDTISKTEITHGGGPAGPAGLILWPGAAPRVAYDAQAQEWTKEPEGRFWVGMEKASPPSPEDLQRDGAVGRYAPDLGDGRSWLLPTAMLVDGSCPLPKVRKIDPETGKVVARPQARYDALRLAADEVKDVLHTGGSLTDEREAMICVEALQANYRVGIVEASMLGLLTDLAIRLIAYVLVDVAQWTEFAEIKDQAARG